MSFKKLGQMQGSDVGTPAAETARYKHEAAHVAGYKGDGASPGVAHREASDEVRLPGDRERLADYSAISALNLLRLMLTGRR